MPPYFIIKQNGVTVTRQLNIAGRAPIIPAPNKRPLKAVKNQRKCALLRSVEMSHLQKNQ